MASFGEVQSPLPMGSMNLEDMLRNIYSEEESSELEAAKKPRARADVSSSGKTTDEVWKEISKPRAGVRGSEMTLEDFLAREEEEGKAGVKKAALAMNGNNNGVDNGGTGIHGGRGRKRQIMDPVDRATVQRQKRMIKNRESAARSRERKQAYVAQLETLVTQLEEENSQLLSHQEEQHQKRLKQLMENLIPVTIAKRPKKQLRRTNSMEW
ncbi:hypothetical protein LUZ60_001707 [Juncus effusus]|nr:hypothetical protein LUZ60_001707 [Juncus effusus]